MSNDTITFLILIAVGALFFIPSFVETLVRLRNQMQGVKTEITSSTYMMYRLFGVGIIILGIALLLQK